MFTAIVAAWTSAVVSRQKLAPLQAQRDALAPLATRLEIGDATSTVVKRLPLVTYNFQWFEVYIPAGKPQEVRFFCGEVTQAGLPPKFESIPLSPGQHQIVLHELYEDFRFLVYVDGQLAFEKIMGKEWMPLGWNRSNFIYTQTRSSSWTAVTAKRYLYLPTVDNAKWSGSYFNGSVDRWATQLGYQLWIDEVGRTPQPINDFVGFFQRSQEKIGLRDGPRIANPWLTTSHGLEFNHPAALSRDNILTIEPEFIVGGKVFAPAKTGGLTNNWEMSRSAEKIEEIKYDNSSTSRSYSIFLHAAAPITGNISPVIELQWTLDRPNDVGLRLPAVAANAQVSRWRLRCIEGLHHLWRIIESGDRSIDINQPNPPAETNPETTSDAVKKVAIPLNNSDLEIQSLKWRTDIAIPLQIAQRTSADSETLKDIAVYKGLPFEFGYEPPASADAKVWVICKDNMPLLETPIPGGRVIDEVVLEIDAKDPSWTWIRFEKLEKQD